MLINPSQLHSQKVKSISDQLVNHHKSGDERTIRFFHGESNSTRGIDKSKNFVVEISSLDSIIQIDKGKRTAVVEPNVSMDKLVTVCLKDNLIPKVVAEFPAITCGGAINGAALESSSFKYSQFFDSCSEIEMVLGDGSIKRASGRENSELFYGISGSYGTLGLITRITLTLIPAKRFVKLTLNPIPTELVSSELEKEIGNKDNDYLEGLVFDKTKSLILKGVLTENGQLPVKTFSKSTDDWFYLYAEKIAKSKKNKEILVPLKDYLFRYDRGAFWMGMHAYKLFHTPFNRFTRAALNPFMKTRVIFKALHRTNLSQRYVVQDFYIPLSKTKKFTEFSNENVGIFPLWLCPIKSTNTPQFLSPHFLSEEMLIDIGVWGAVKEGGNILEINQRLEKLAYDLGGRKMLYAENFYSQESFWKIYNKERYQTLRKKYQANKAFPDIWEKIRVDLQSYTNPQFDKVKIVKTTLQTMLEALLPS